MGDKTDFNDLHVEKGLQVVKEQLEKAVDNFCKGINSFQEPVQASSSYDYSESAEVRQHSVGVEDIP